jgi:L-gulono-1,4-lactone dehydrogenase
MLSRRDFVQRAGLALASGLVGGACRPCDPNVSDKILAPLNGVACRTGHEFVNWAQTIKFRPRRFCRPRTEAEVVATVRNALEAQTKVRTQGAGHSFSQLLATDDTLLTLDDLETPITVDGRRVTVPGGIRLKSLIKELRARGLGLRNIGSITEQSIAGAFSTGTHGTGIGLGAIHTQVAGVRLVDGQGVVRTLSGQDAEHLAAARVNLGALGIITQVTLDCVPDYSLEYTAYLTQLDVVLRHLDQLVQENERVLFWWFLLPGCPRDSVVLVTKNPLGHPVSEVLRSAHADRPRSSTARRSLAKEAGTVQKMAQQAPAREFVKLIQYVGTYDQVLTIPLLPVFHRECEYAIPATRTVEAVRTMREFVEESELSLTLPVEVRYVAPDDALLSPSHDGPVSYVGASTLTNSSEVFERFEPLMKRLGGRPHWGKNAVLTRAEAAALYAAGYDRFRAVRDAFDPGRVFGNTLLAELFP